MGDVKKKDGVERKKRTKFHIREGSLARNSLMLKSSFSFFLYSPIQCAKQRDRAQNKRGIVSVSFNSGNVTAPTVSGLRFVQADTVS